MSPISPRRRQRSTTLRQRRLAVAVAAAGGIAILSGGIAAAQPAASPSPSQSVDPSATPCPPPAAYGSPTPGATPDPGASPASQPCAADAGPSPSPSAVAAAPQVLVGQIIQTQFGDTQVQVTVDGGRIVDVTPMQLPYDRQRSAQISQIVAPMLHDEVLQAQSAQIDLISGATYTSEAYAQSLQSALDQADPDLEDGPAGRPQP